MVIKEIKQPRAIESIESQKLDLSLFKKRGNSKTFKGYLLQKLKESRKQENLDVALLIQHFYKKYLEFETSEKVVLKSWKGKSSLQIIEKPNYFIVITYQKPNQDENPVEIKREIPKLEVNRIIKTISELNEGKKISTRDIGEMAYKREWDKIFSDRFLHTNLNLILRLLDHYNITHYRGKSTTVIRKVNEIQDVL